jgi:hypothetical protein
MATGAASQLAGLAGVGALKVPILWLTVLVAGVATASGLLGAPRRQGPRPPLGRFGQFTIPVGLAVIGIGLAELRGPAAVAAAVAAVALAWGATFVLTMRVVVPVALSQPGLSAVTGVWFIAPAAFLADAAGAAALTGSPGAPAATVVAWLAVAACVVGTASFFVAVGLAGARVAAHGLVGAPRAAWWIVVGCGGLAAAALGEVDRVAPVGRLAAFGWAALACWVLASAALVPVGAGSLRHVLGVRRLSGQPPWPPAFSTAVYALGTAQVAALFDLPWAADLARVAAIETLLVWAVTGALRVGALASRVHPGQGRPPRAAGD